MPAAAWIALKLVARLAWPYIAPFLFELLSKWFGKGLMEFAYKLIGENTEAIMTGAMSKREAREKAAEVIMEATQNSPGINETWSMIIAHAALVKWTEDYIPVKYERQIDGLVLHQQKNKNMTVDDYISWYNSHPDWKKK